MKYIKDKGDNKNLPSRQARPEDKINFPGYPLYPVSEDIYNKYQKEDNIDPEDISKIKVANKDEKAGAGNEKDPVAAGFDEETPGSDLDVPGSELDDAQENTGSEDEENNYYSLGGDDHNDLEEDKGA